MSFGFGRWELFLSWYCWCGEWVFRCRAACWCRAMMSKFKVFYYCFLSVLPLAPFATLSELTQLCDLPKNPCKMGTFCYDYKLSLDRYLWYDGFVMRMQITRGPPRWYLQRACGNWPLKRWASVNLIRWCCCCCSRAAAKAFLLCGMHPSLAFRRRSAPPSCTASQCPRWFHPRI